jgi:hypothetical protein
MGILGSIQRWTQSARWVLSALSVLSVLSRSPQSPGF